MDDVEGLRFLLKDDFSLIMKTLSFKSYKNVLISFVNATTR